MIDRLNTNRRSFFKGLSGLAVSVVGYRSALRSKLRLGGPIFLKSDDPVELARAHRQLGYSAAYVPQVSLAETEKIKAIEKAFASENVVIAEVGQRGVFELGVARQRRRHAASIRKAGRGNASTRAGGAGCSLACEVQPAVRRKG